MTEYGEATQDVYDMLLEGDLEVSTCEAFRTLVDFMENKKPIGGKLLTKFRELNILNDNNEIEMEEPDSIIEWILLGLVFEGKIKRVKKDV